MSSETIVRPQTIERLERRLDRQAEALERIKERQATQETDMVQLAGEMREWRAEARARDEAHTASIDRTQKSMELTASEMKAFRSEQSTALTSLQSTLEGILRSEAAREAVEADREKRRASQPTLSAVRPPGSGNTGPVPQPPQDPSLAAAHGWLGLVKSMPPWLILVLLVGCIGFGVSLAIIMAIKYL